MEFTVFTSGGGLREFLGESSYQIGEHNGVLYVFDAKTGQVLAYGATAWASVQEWRRDGDDAPGRRRKLVAETAEVGG